MSKRRTLSSYWTSEYNDPSTLKVGQSDIMFLVIKYHNKHRLAMILALGKKQRT